jgi:hypothetical protein
MRDDLSVLPIMLYLLPMKMSAVLKTPLTRRQVIFRISKTSLSGRLRFPFDPDMEPEERPWRYGQIMWR